MFPFLSYSKDNLTPLGRALKLAKYAKVLKVPLEGGDSNTLWKGLSGVLLGATRDYDYFGYKFMLQGPFKTAEPYALVYAENADCEDWLKETLRVTGYKCESAQPYLGSYPAEQVSVE